jgi:hypothetical protein
MDVDISAMPTLDLFKAAKLGDLSFRRDGPKFQSLVRFRAPSLQRITVALQTVQSRLLRQIAVQQSGVSIDPVEEMALQEWQGLESTLAQSWASHSIHPKIVYQVGKEGGDLRALAPSLLPELMRRGLVDLVEDQC